MGNRMCACADYRTTHLILRSGTFQQKNRDVRSDHVYQKRQIISAFAIHSRLFCNHLSPMFTVPCPWMRPIIIVATDTGDSDP